MRRGEVILSIAMLSLAACGGGSSTPDAELVHTVDAPPPPPDAMICSLTMCGTECVDTTSDPLFCGDCLTSCDQAGSTCVDSACVCPPSFLPDTLSNGFQDMILTQLPGAYVALTPFIVSEIDALAVAYPTAGVTLNDPITLDGATLPNPPFVAAAYNIDPNTFQPAAAYAAVSGTLTFTSACDVGASGTLTDATFQAVGDITNPMVDPNGCSFTVASLSFNIGTACP